jgi:uncharacterized phiE125 gp8 family phage protein
MIPLLPKLAGEVRRYRHDWTPFLGLDTIASHVTSITGATLDSTTVEAGNRSVVFKVSGGVAGTPAQITHEITTANGDEEIQVFLIPIGAEEPVTLREAKAQTRMLEDDSEDEFLQSLIPSARAYVEKVSRHLFVGGSRTETFRRWGDYLEIWRRPITSVTSVSYSVSDDPADDVDYTGFATDYNSFPLRIYPAFGGTGFPELEDGQVITVTYTAGTLSETSEEYLIGKRAMLLLIGFWFDNRGEVPLSKEVKFALDEMLGALAPLSAY